MSKRVFVGSYFYDNVFSPGFHFRANQIHFHMTGFAWKLVMKKKLKLTGKSTINPLVGTFWTLNFSSPLLSTFYLGKKSCRLDVRQANPLGKRDRLTVIFPIYLCYPIVSNYFSVSISHCVYWRSLVFSIRRTSVFAVNKDQTFSKRSRNHLREKHCDLLRPK